MPNNENNNFNNQNGFELANMNNETNNQPVNNINPIGTSSGPKIEIPDKYYEVLAKEVAEQNAIEQQAIAKQNEKVATNNAFSKILFFAVLSGVIIFLFLFLTVEKIKIAIIGIPLYIVVGTIIFALKDKKDSVFPQSLIVGGMGVAVITFLLSTDETKIDYWTYFALASGISAFVGLIVGNMITKVLTEAKEMKGLQTIGYILVFAALIGGPVFFYYKFPEEFQKIVFLEKNPEIKAETEEEFTMKTLQNRYDIKFTCNSKTKKLYDEAEQRLIIRRVCNDGFGHEINVDSTMYNQLENQYIVVDNYLDVLFFNNVKKDLTALLKKGTGATDVLVSFYPKENCTFQGDCAPCDEYYANYENEYDYDKRYKASTSLNYSEHVEKTYKQFRDDFINKNNYKIIVTIRGEYTSGTEDHKPTINKVLELLNNNGYKNTYGYEIFVNNYKVNNYETTVYSVKGKASDDGQFKNPEVTKDNQDKIPTTPNKPVNENSKN